MLETAANPYVTLLGDPRTSAGRLNLAQSFNGLGCIMGVLLGGQFFLHDDVQAGGGTEIALPYTFIGIIVLAVAFAFTRVKLPEVAQMRRAGSVGASTGFTPLFFVGLAALIAYEIAEISINTFFINYMSDDGFLSPKDAATLLSIGGLGLFLGGRVVGSLLMRRIAAPTMLRICAIGTIVTRALTMMPLGLVSKLALVACFAFESIMFPPIFALSLGYAGSNTERASSVLMLSVVGGAIGPLAMGWVSDAMGNAASFAVPLAGFAVVLVFSLLARNK